jgi:hypothetical protein
MSGRRASMAYWAWPSVMAAPWISCVALADVTEFLGILESQGGGRRYRQTHCGSGHRAEAEPTTALLVHQFVIAGAHLAGRYAPARRRRGFKYGARGGRDVSHVS